MALTKVTSGIIEDGTVDTIDIADDAVTTDKLADAINTTITANTAKVTNATHTGDVTGATALTIAVDAVDIPMLSATGTADATTFLRGDNSWVAAASGGGTAGVQVYDTTSTPYTWTKSTRESAIGKTINRVLVEVQGGGGGGGSTVNGWTGGGGGAGGYSMKLIDVSSITTSTIVVGTGGAATGSGITSSWADGTNTLTGVGGSPGNNGTNPGYGNGGWGGAGTGGDLNIEGMTGNEGQGNAQMGGGSRFAGAKHTVTGGTTNASATNYGHGGYGASTGGGGLVLVWEIN